MKWRVQVVNVPTILRTKRAVAWSILEMIAQREEELYGWLEYSRNRDMGSGAQVRERKLFCGGGRNKPSWRRLVTPRMRDSLGRQWKVGVRPLRDLGADRIRRLASVLQATRLSRRQL